MGWSLIVGIPIAVIVCSLLLEFKLGTENMLQNICNVIIGIAIAFLVTVLVVNNLIDYREQKEWEKVRKNIYSRLVKKICSISASCTPIYGISLTDKYRLVKDPFPPNNSTLSAFNDLIKELNKNNINGNIPTTYNQGDHGADMKFYEYIKFDLEHIQIVLTPRIIQGRGEQEIIDSLVAFESAGDNFRDEVFLRYTCFPQVVSLIEKACIVYETIYKNWNE